MPNQTNLTVLISESSGVKNKMSNKHNVYAMSPQEELDHVKEILVTVKKENKSLNSMNAELKTRAQKAEALLEPVKLSLQKLTAENGKRLRKEARIKNSK